MSEFEYLHGRQVVHRYLNAPKMGAEVIKAWDTEDPRDLKLAEYALLTGPISRGIEAYLDSADLMEDLAPLDLDTIRDRIGYGVARKVLPELNKDEVAYSQASTMAKARAEHTPRAYGESISPLGRATVDGSLGSSSAMLNAAVAVRETAIKAGLEGNELRRVVRNSTQLPLLRTMIAFDWQQSVDADILLHTQGAEELERGPILSYDERKQEVRLARPIERWPNFFQIGQERARPEESGVVGDIPVTEVRVGCPVSFTPRLVSRYYQHVVDVIEYHQAWPGTV